MNQRQRYQWDTAPASWNWHHANGSLFFGFRTWSLSDEQRSERPSPPFHPVLFLPLSVNFVGESAEVPKTVFVTGMLPCYWIAVSNSL